MNTVTRPVGGNPRAAHDEPRLGPLTAVAASCTAGNCPTVYVAPATTETRTLVVQGLLVPAERAGVTVPDGEALVEIPLDLLLEAARHLS